jgi:hypothetical protein
MRPVNESKQTKNLAVLRLALLTALYCRNATAIFVATVNRVSHVVPDSAWLVGLLVMLLYTKTKNIMLLCKSQL